MVYFRHIKLIRRASYFVFACLFAVLGPVESIFATTDADNKAASLDTIWFDPLIHTTPPACNTGGVASVGPSFNLGVTAEERQAGLIGALMADYGLTAEQAAGPVGNFMRESAGTETAAVKLPPDVNQGDTVGAPPKFDGGGYGWAQWTGGRQTTFIDFAVEKGLMSSKTVNATDGANYEYLKHELASSYKQTIPELKKQASPEQAAVSFEATFERAGDKALDDRKRLARTAFNSYKSIGGDALTPSAAGCSDVAILGDVAFPLQGSKKVVNNPQMFHDGDADQGGHPYTAYDIMSDAKTTVVAFMAGEVNHFGSDTCGGRLVTIYNKEKNMTISYMHMNTATIEVKEGDTVKPGDPVGHVGDFPVSVCGGNHLHIDAIKGSVRVACSRSSCPESSQKLFIPIGKSLYETYQALPDN